MAEWEHINENKTGRANQCRELIDMVIKKGEHSCNVLLKIIMEKDPALSQDLKITAPVKSPLEKKEQTSQAPVKPPLEKKEETSQEQNYKGKLISHCLLSGLTYRFENSSTGPPHDQRGCVGSSDQLPLVFSWFQADVNYVGLFNEFCQRNKCSEASFVETCRGPSHLQDFFCYAFIGKMKFPEAKGINKKEAKKNAARLALKVLKKKHIGDLELQRIPGLDDL